MPEPTYATRRTALAQRLRAQGWNLCLDACIALICPDPPVEEERSCEEIKRQLEALRRPVMIGDYTLEAWGTMCPEPERDEA